MGHLGQRRPSDQLHGVVVNAAFFPDRVDRDNVRMLERRNRPHLVFKPPQRHFISQGYEWQHFQCDLAAHRELLGLVNDAHPATANFTHNLEIAESVIVSQAIRCCGAKRRTTAGGKLASDEFERRKDQPNLFGDLWISFGVIFHIRTVSPVQQLEKLISDFAEQFVD